MKFVHITDLHFIKQTLSLKKRKHKKRNKELGKRLKFLIDNFSKSTFIITGDITEDGQKREYKMARKKLYNLKNRVLFAPGNHDYGLNGMFYNKWASKRFDNFINELMTNTVKKALFYKFNDPILTEFKKEKLITIGLDSNIEDHTSPFLARGEIGNHQLHELKHILEKYSDWKKIVYLHHHPLDNKFILALNDDKKFLEIVEGKVDVVLFGHMHKSRVYYGEKRIRDIKNGNFKRGKTLYIETDALYEKKGIRAREIEISDETIKVTNLKLPKV